MERLIQYYEFTYFTSFGLLIVSIIGLITSIKKRKDIPEFKYIPFYFSGYIILSVSTALYTFSTNTINKPGSPLYLPTIIDLFFTILELFIFINIIQNKVMGMKNTFRILKIAFLLFGLVYLVHDLYVYNNVIFTTIHLMFNVQAIILIFCSLIFYFKAYGELTRENYFSDPSFWVVTAVLLSMVSITPLSLFLNYLTRIDDYLANSLFTIVNVFYIILFLTIIKSYTLKSRGYGFPG